MDPQRIVSEIEALGLSQYAMARILRKRGCRISQSTINRIANGETKDPSYRVVSALDDLRRGLQNNNAA